MPRHPDAGLLQPCERPTGAIPTPLPYKVLAQLWVTAEQLLAACAASKDRLINFENNEVPKADAAPTTLDPKVSAKKSLLDRLF